MWFAPRPGHQHRILQREILQNVPELTKFKSQISQSPSKLDQKNLPEKISL